MKTFFTMILLVIWTIGLHGQNNYEEAMIRALTQLGSASSTSDYRAVAAQFERIAEVESGEWLPPYYASMVYCIMSFQTEDPSVKEGYVAQAQKQIDAAMKVAPEESEVHTMQGMIYQATIMIDPQANGQIYSAKANGSFQTAMKLNSTNPRPLYLEATSVMHTPEQFGGGKATALPIFEQAMELFDSFKPASPLYPNWGREDCEVNLAVCKAGS